MRLTGALLVAGWIAAVSVRAEIPQTRRLTGPQPPGGRIVSTHEDCNKLAEEWNQYKDAWTKQHQACLDSYAKNYDVKPTPGPKGCSKSPCQQLHYLVYEYAASESTRANDECRAAVNKIQKEKAEYEAQVRKYNQQIAEYNRKLLAQLMDQRAAEAEQNRRAAEVVAERNHAAQQEFERLQREFGLRMDRARELASATVTELRDMLRSGMSQVGQRVSNLVDELGSTTFNDVVGQAGDAADTGGTIFDGLHAAYDIEPPERVTTAIERVQNFTAGWNIFQSIRTALSDTATPQERFDSQVSGLSSSTTFLFRSTPWVAPRVSDNLESIGRSANTVVETFENSFTDPSAFDGFEQRFGRALFPRSFWLNDKIKQVEGAANNLFQFFGR